jgi:hypothetical protein
LGILAHFCAIWRNFGAILAQFLAEMSHFDKDCAITCGNVGILIKIAQLLAEMLEF